MISAPLPKPTEFVGASQDDLQSFPEAVRYVFGFALYNAQLGAKHPDAKPLKGFKGSGVLEVVNDFDGDTYRALYTVKFAGVVYVLHCFQKKAKRGIATPKKEIDTIKARLARAPRPLRSQLQGPLRRGLIE